MFMSSMKQIIGLLLDESLVLKHKSSFVQVTLLILSTYIIKCTCKCTTLYTLMFGSNICKQNKFWSVVYFRIVKLENLILHQPINYSQKSFVLIFGHELLQYLKKKLKQVGMIKSLSKKKKDFFPPWQYQGNE